ncbi:MAG: glycerol kinase GlpK [Formosimonas sp.]
MYILALDQGTTSSRAIVVNHAGEVVEMAQQEFPQIYPQAAWVEHDPEDIWHSQLAVIERVLQQAQLTSTDIAAIGITNQRETTIVWDKRTGKAIYNAIVWQDKRTADYCAQLNAQGHADMVREKTGLLLDSYFSASKIRWILDHVHDAQTLAEQGHLAFGTVDSWLTWRLTHGEKHITDVSNAARTLLFNINTLQWDAQLLSLFNIPIQMLPQVHDSSELISNVYLPNQNTSIPLAGIAGDQHAALFGQMAWHKGMVKNTYGTGCFMMMNTGEQPVASKHNLLTTVAWKIGEHVQYALEGSIFIGGAVVQWLRDGLHMINESKEVQALAASVPDSDGVYVVPAFTGLGAPHWQDNARGMILGLTRGSTDAHIARAALESIALQTMDVLQAMQHDAGIDISVLRVDGGASANDLLLQFQADVLNIDVVRPKFTETTALGAAYLAGLAVGFWRNTEELAAQWRSEHIFASQAEPTAMAQKIAGWQHAVRTVAFHANSSHAQ